MTEQLRPMSVEQVRSVAAPVVEFPPFDDGTPFRARARRVSMLAAIASGTLPNSLLSVAWKAIKAGNEGQDVMKSLSETEDPELLKQFFGLFLKGVLVEPTWEEVGEYLNEEQVSAILAYATQGARALESFRGGQVGDASPGGSGEDVGSPAQQPDPGTG